MDFLKVYCIISGSGTIVCGRYDNGMWSEGACKTLRVSSEMTQCTCDDQGMYALLLARETTQVGSLIKYITVGTNKAHRRIQHRERNLYNACYTLNEIS